MGLKRLFAERSTHLRSKHRLRARFDHLVGIGKPSTYYRSELFLVTSGYFPHSPPEGLEERLSALLREEGSDKSSNHDYHRIYRWILCNVPSGPVVEIGLGTNNLDVPSNMGIKGIPGASLRAWSKTGIFTTVWGADVDRRILFSEPGIQTRFVDQLDEATMRAFADELHCVFPEGVSLLIDDGLHSSDANTNTIRFLWPTIREQGYLCIEDLNNEDLHRVLSFVIRNLGDAKWALWSNVERGPENQMLVLKKESPRTQSTPSNLDPLAPTAPPLV